MDSLGLVGTVDISGEHVVVAVANPAEGGLDASLGQRRGVADAGKSRTSVGLMHDADYVGAGAPVARLIRGVASEGGMRGAADPAAKDAPGKSIDDEGEADEA